MDPSKDESHVDNAPKQETTAQPKAENALFAANAAPIMSTDVTSLMKQLVSLQQQNTKLESLVNTRDKILTEKEEFIKSLTEKKRMEMQNELKNGIDMWLQAMDLKNPEFKTALFQCYQEMNGSVLSIAEMIIQLTAHKFQTELREELLPPMRIQEKHLNETNARIAIESARARLYASQPVKKIIEKNLNTFAKSHAQTWLLETFT